MNTNLLRFVFASIFEKPVECFPPLLPSLSYNEFFESHADDEAVIPPRQTDLEEALNH